MAEEKEPFVAATDRPDVNLNPDAPISELRVRDLQALLQGSAQFKNTMEKRTFPDKQFKTEMNKNEIKWEKMEYPEKYWYPEKYIEVKAKLEKLEHKDFKVEMEKLTALDAPPRPEQQAPGPAGIDQLVQTVSKLSEQVSQLSQDVEKLKQQPGGGHS